MDQLEQYDQQRNEYLSRLLPTVEMATSIEVVDSQEYGEWSRLIPRECYGPISVTTGNVKFISAYKNALARGELNHYLEEQLGAHPDFDTIYVVRSTGECSPRDAKIREQHTPDFLEAKRKEISEFQAGIEATDLPNEVKALYRKCIQSESQFISTASSLGRVEFTKFHKTDEEWLSLLDIEESKRQGRAVLKYTKQARDLLRVARESKKFPEASTIGEALQTWNLTSGERVFLDYKEEEKELDAQQIQRLFMLLLRRIGVITESNLEGEWKVEVNANMASINVNSEGKIVGIPGDRRLHASELKYIISHEFVHILRGVNGSAQSISLVQEGIPGYLETEEGIAVLVEMILGEPFGHDRQVKQAARYLAVALALETEDDPNGKKKAKYSQQEIFDLLRKEEVSELDAKDIVWRINRGTSLQHEVTTLSLPTVGAELSIAECYTKDAVYFEGMMSLLDWTAQGLPPLPSQREKPARPYLAKLQEFDKKILIAIGLGRRYLEGTQSETDTMPLRERYKLLSNQGRKTLLEMVDRLLIAKLSMNELSLPYFQQHLEPARVPYAMLFAPPTSSTQVG